MLLTGCEHKSLFTDTEVTYQKGVLAMADSAGLSAIVFFKGQLVYAIVFFLVNRGFIKIKLRRSSVLGSSALSMWLKILK